MVKVASGRGKLTFDLLHKSGLLRRPFLSIHIEPIKNHRGQDQLMLDNESLYAILDMDRGLPILTNIYLPP